MLKLYVYAGLAIAVLGGGWWLHNHLVNKGVQQQRAADAEAYAKLQRDADLETGRLKGLADAAEKANAEELKDLRQYRADHPIAFRVCFPNRGSGDLPKATSSEVQHENPSTAATVGERVPSSDPVVTEDRGPLLDAFAALFDETSANLRQWQNR